MILKWIEFSFVCDFCPDAEFTHTDQPNSKTLATQKAKENGWSVNKGKVKCPSCK